jgi:hypothetical protein
VNFNVNFKAFSSLKKCICWGMNSIGIEIAKQTDSNYQGVI